jgi:predicted phosphodiesterase
VVEQFGSQKELAAQPRAAAPPHFVVAPYLQLPTRDGITVMWETSVPGPGVVEYGTSTPPTQKAARQEIARIHEVRLTGLLPNTKYYYRVATPLPDGRALTSELRTFHTAVDADSAFSFVLFGDTQKNPEMTGKIARLAWARRPHFALHLGDVVDNGPDKAEWEDELFRPCVELFGRVPVFPTIGNHEKDHAWYYRYFSLPQPEYYYRYRYGNADFFVLDSNKPLGPGSEQYAWLERELERSDARWRFAYHHHPAYSSDDNDYGKTWTDSSSYGDLNVRPLVQLYEKYKVDIVFNGHIHVYERSWPLRAGKVDRERGVIHITSGGGGGRLENFAPTPTWFKAQVRVDYHFCLVNIHQGKLEFRAFDQHGRMFDSFTLDKK